MRDDPAVPRFGRPYGVEMTELVEMTQERPHPAERLAGDGWRTEVVRTVELAEQWGRPLPPTSTGMVLDNDFVVARR